MSETGGQAAVLAMALGGLLVVVGVGSYVATDFAHVTALIPAIFGVLIAALGALGRERNRQRPAMYGVGVLAVLGVAGSLRGVPDILAVFTGDEVDSLVGPLSQGVMIVVCLVLVGAVGRYVLDTR